VSQCTYEGDYREAVVRSLITLKALTYEPTGGIVAAATTSLPETLGGNRNWDYRFCWLRDATLTLESLMRGGFYQEAMAWRNWLLRATAGDPSQMQIMYGAAGERRLDEWEVDWLPGYEGSSPVRIGNAAAGQFQLDVYGEVMSALYESEPTGQSGDSPTWEFQLALMDFLRDGWREPDDGIWEVRGPRRHFTHSKVMAWVAIDRAIKTSEEYGMEAPLDRWKEVRQEIHDQVCDQGFDASRGSFTQYYGSDELDASLLMIPLVGFLPAHDPRVRGTIEAIERELVDGGFVLRYRTVATGDVDGLSGREGAFLACSFWLADCLTLLGRDHDARQLLDRLMGLRNDLGLLAEEYDPVAGSMVGNFPQAFSHVSLVNSASKLMGQEKPTSEHIVLGLARRALTRGSSPSERHLSGVSAQSMVARLAQNAGQQRGAARLVREAVSSTRGGGPESASADKPSKAAGREVRRRGKPTTRPTAKKATPLATKAPVSTGAKGRGASGGAKQPPRRQAAGRPAMPAQKAAPTKTAAPAKRAAPVKKAVATRARAKATTKKTPAKKAGAAKTTPKKVPTKQSAVANAPAKKAPAATGR
jgi:hypothetical protein